MKVRLVYIALFAVVLFLIPMAALGFGLMPEKTTSAQIHTPVSVSSSQPVALPGSTEEVAPPPLEDTADLDTDDDLYSDEDLVYRPTEQNYDAVSYGTLSFRILDLSTGKVNEVSLRDYVRGAVAAEMPVSFHGEALKAQAVAAHTYALHNHLVQQQTPDPFLKGADFSADPSNRKGYMTEKTAKAFYGGGEMADLYWDKICEAADSVVDLIMEYDGEPIVAAYHAISAGTTESAANVWSGEAPYLLPADSEGDLLAPGYESVVVLPAGEVKNILLSVYPEMELIDDPVYWFTAIERSESGYITYADVGGVELHGKDIRGLFDLRSHNIEIAVENGDFYFYVYGYGHGVGLSQYGADFLARQGYTFDEILENYYTGIALRKIDFSAPE